MEKFQNVAALNFRHAGAGYPASSADINYAIRWLKAHAGKLNLRAGTTFDLRSALGEGRADS